MARLRYFFLGVNLGERLFPRLEFNKSSTTPITITMSDKLIAERSNQIM